MKKGYTHTGPIGNSVIYTSKLENCSWDGLNDATQRITGIPDPQLETDAVNFRTLRRAILGIQQIELKRRLPTPIPSNQLYGNFEISIFSDSQGYPLSTVRMGKISAEVNLDSANFVYVSVPGDDETTFLQFEWPSNSSILVSKNTNAYDSIYNVTIRS